MLTPEQSLLQTARSGDEHAFQRAVEPFRRELFSRCRRMLGSGHDAEDALQETLLKAWRALPALKSQTALRPWLHRIAANVCLTALANRPTHLVSIDDTPHCMVDGDLDASYEQRETAALAVGVAFGRLPPSQRAALILRETLGYSAGEIASTLGTTTASVNSALQRARASLGDRTEVPTDVRVQDAVDGFVAALGRDDVDALVGIAVDGKIRESRSWAYSALPAY